MIRSDTRDFQRRYGTIPDAFSSLAQVQEKLQEVGLESCNLIVGVDFTQSNTWQGRVTFGGRSLHALGAEPNPYEQAISIVGQTLEDFDEDNLIPCFGFGDKSTCDRSVFPFYQDWRPCRGFNDAVQRYREIAPHVTLWGPTSFAPLIRQAIQIVEASGRAYHVLVIIADGQMYRPENLPRDQMSDQERATVDAICEASNYPLSILLVGVGDGPWDTMHMYDDALQGRKFDNFQFVNFTEIMGRVHEPPNKRAARFALMALMEVPFQFQACVAHNLLGMDARQRQ